MFAAYSHSLDRKPACEQAKTIMEWKTYSFLHFNIGIRHEVHDTLGDGVHRSLHFDDILVVPLVD